MGNKQGKINVIFKSSPAVFISSFVLENTGSMDPVKQAINDKIATSGYDGLRLVKIGDRWGNSYDSTADLKTSSSYYLEAHVRLPEEPDVFPVSSAQPELADIGFWGSHEDTPLVGVLMRAGVNGDSGHELGGNASAADVAALVSGLKRAKFGPSRKVDTVQTYGKLNTRAAEGPELLSLQQRGALIALIDAMAEQGPLYRDARGREDEDVESDFKAVITPAALAGAVGKDAAAALAAEMVRVHGVSHDMIKVRRVRARTEKEGQHCINFHLDFAHDTMAISLNSPDQYDGGRIVYADETGALLTPRATPGRALHHDNSWVHGVTRLTRGTRYHLFFLSHAR